MLLNPFVCLMMHVCRKVSVDFTAARNMGLSLEDNRTRKCGLSCNQETETALSEDFPMAENVLDVYRALVLKTPS